MIEKYFEKYPGAIISFNYISNTKTIHFWMKNTWELPSTFPKEMIGLKEDRNSVDKQNPDRYYCIIYGLSPEINDTEETNHKEISYQNLFDALSYIFDTNIEKERKLLLLSEMKEQLQQNLQLKMADLQNKFQELSLDEFEKLKVV